MVGPPLSVWGACVLYLLSVVGLGVGMLSVAFANELSRGESPSGHAEGSGAVQ